MSTVNIPSRVKIPLRKLKEFVCASRTPGIPTAWSPLWVVTRKRYLSKRLCVCINVKLNFFVCISATHLDIVADRGNASVSPRGRLDRKRELMDVCFFSLSRITDVYVCIITCDPLSFPDSECCHDINFNEIFILKALSEWKLLAACRAQLSSEL